MKLVLLASRQSLTTCQDLTRTARNKWYVIQHKTHRSVFPMLMSHPAKAAGRVSPSEARCGKRGERGLLLLSPPLPTTPKAAQPTQSSSSLFGLCRLARSLASPFGGRTTLLSLSRAELGTLHTHFPNRFQATNLRLPWQKV